MSKIYITGDCHADFRKFSTACFPEQKQLTRDDFVIVCGDFGGVWYESPAEKYWLDWLRRKNFTILYVDGNHENFDRLLSDEFETVDFHGGKAHKIRDNIYHLMRGYIFELCGKKIFTFGGASSHDIQDGILDPNDFEEVSDLIKTYNSLTRKGKLVRINHLSWWQEEMPSNEEMEFGKQNLADNENKVDYIISHCCPQTIATLLSKGYYKADKLTDYFDEIKENTSYKKWFFGHYHTDRDIDEKHKAIYNDIIKLWQ